MQHIFISIFDYFKKHKTQYWVWFTLLFAFAAFGAYRIKFENDINKMIPHDAHIEAMSNILNKTKTGEQLIFNMQLSDNTTNPDSLIFLQNEFETELKEKLGEYTNGIQSVSDDNKDQQFADIALQNLPLFLEEKDYHTIDSLLTPQALKNNIENLHKLLLSPAGMVAKTWASADPIGMMPLAFNKFKSINFDPNYELYNGYIFNSNLEKLTFFVTPKYPSNETGENKIFIERLDKIIAAFSEQHKVSILYFGGVAVAASNAAQMQKDSIFTLSLTVIMLLGLTFYVFRRKRIPLIIIIPVLFGALFGLAMTALLQGTVSVIAIGAGAIILGIAVDFSVHFMSHARTHPDMRENVKSLTAPLTLGAITTIGAFFALRFANAPLLQDLGTFAAFSLLCSSLFTLIFLPHIMPRTKGKNDMSTKENILDKLALYHPEKSKWLLVFVIILTPIFWYFANKVEFEGDLMKLNYMSSKLGAAQDSLNKDNAFALSSLFIVATGTSKENAAQNLEKQMANIDSFVVKGFIKKSITPVSILPSKAEQQRRIEKWKAYWTQEKINSTIALVKAAGQQAGFSADAFQDFENTLRHDYTLFDSGTVQIIEQTLPASFAQDNNKHYAIATLKVAPENRLQVMNAFENKTNITVTDKQSVSEKLLSLLKNDFNKILFISGSLVFLALLIAYGRLELALISFLPMAVSWVWILGLMSIFGLKFNVVNIVIATLLFGLGDDYSIFMMDSLMEKYRTGKNLLKSARSAVYLSVTTTIIGLGTLIFAKHPALQSIAGISIIGLICVVFISQILQPFLFNFLIQNRANKGFMPFTLWSLTKSVFSFLYFSTGAMLLSILGFFLIKLNIIGKKRGKYVFHYALSKYTRSVMYIMTNLTKVVNINPAVNFQKPAIYIANHSSFLDILLTTMLHPKLVLLTNKWVYRSPVFGAVVRMAEYYPVADGAEDSIEPLKSLVDRGYGIVIFPEGTRSKSDKMGRFHKGAFFLSEQLKLDIVPIVLHGVHYTMQKGDFLLKDGTTRVNVLAPILYEDRTWGETVKDRTKAITQFFKSSFLLEKTKRETPSYFREQIIRGNTYKGPVLEWYCRVKTKLENNYEPFHTLLPRSGKFYDLGCGYGFMTYMLHWSAMDRIFIGVDYDEDKIITAQHHYKKDDNINFIHANVTQFDLEICDGIIISDVLHYLLPEQQSALLDKCYNALNTGGKLILRDGVKELEERHKGTELTEKFSTKILKFNKTKNELHFISKAFIEDWAKKHNMHIKQIDNTKNTSNLIFVMVKQ